jgi:hypothetical protein
LFQLGLSLAARGEASNGIVAMERGLRGVNADWLDMNPNHRRLWQLKWVVFWRVSNEHGKFEQSLNAFLSNRKVLLGNQEMIRLLISCLVQSRVGALKADVCHELRDWRDNVMLNSGLVGAS